MRKIIRIPTQMVLLVLFFGWFILPENDLQAGQEPQSGRYVNCDFGYTVTVPAGLTSQIPEYFNHGFEIKLPDRESTIEIYNAYNMSTSTAPSAVFSYQLEARKAGRHAWRIVSKRASLVRGLDSMRLTAKYTRDGAPWKSEILIAYRAKQTDGLGNIVYVVELSTPARPYERVIPYFNETVEGFQLTELPRGECSNK